jgi:hypothetical protein
MPISPEGYAGIALGTLLLLAMCVLLLLFGTYRRRVQEYKTAVHNTRQRRLPQLAHEATESMNPLTVQASSAVVAPTALQAAGAASREAGRDRFSSDVPTFMEWLTAPKVKTGQKGCATGTLHFGEQAEPTSLVRETRSGSATLLEMRAMDTRVGRLQRMGGSTRTGFVPSVLGDSTSLRQIASDSVRNQAVPLKQVSVSQHPEVLSSPEQPKLQMKRRSLFGGSTMV